MCGDAVECAHAIESQATPQPRIGQMRILIAVIAVALLIASALAQGSGKGKRQQQDAAKKEDPARKKADEEAYRKALKSIPDSKEKQDPWKGVR